MSVADLDSIAAEDRADAPPTPAGAEAAPGAEAVPAGPTLAQEIEGLVSLAVKVLSPAFPSLPSIYTDEITGAAAGAVAAVCQKHGWLSGGLAGQYGEELAALVIVGPLAVQTYTACKADAEARRAKAPPQVERPVQPVELQPVPDNAAADEPRATYEDVLNG